MGSRLTQSKTKHQELSSHKADGGNESEEFDVEQVIQKRKDEKTFQKEFAKDLKKLNKIKVSSTLFKEVYI